MTENETRPLRIMQITLLAGPLVLLGIVKLVRRDPEPTWPAPVQSYTLTMISVVAGVLLAAAAFVLPRPKGGDVNRLRAHFIQRLALAEAGALLGVTAYLIEGSAVAACMALLCGAVIAFIDLPWQRRRGSASVQPPKPG